MRQKEVKNRRLTGVIVSDAMQKTRVVAITRIVRHPKYPKYRKVTSRLKAHDEANQFLRGETVVIEETRPLSKDKRWRIVGRAADLEKRP